MTKIKLLKEYLIVSYESIACTTKYRETLSYVERRQYNCNGLLHVKDTFYEFLTCLEQARINHLKITHCQTFRETFLFDVKEAMLNDTDYNLQQKFEKEFQDTGDICLPDGKKVRIRLSPFLVLSIICRIQIQFNLHICSYVQKIEYLAGPVTKMVAITEWKKVF